MCGRLPRWGGMQHNAVCQGGGVCSTMRVSLHNACQPAGHVLCQLCVMPCVPCLVCHACGSCLWPMQRHSLTSAPLHPLFPAIPCKCGHAADVKHSLTPVAPHPPPHPPTHPLTGHVAHVQAGSDATQPTASDYPCGAAHRWAVTVWGCTQVGCV